ncbi:MAG: DNA-binding response OmpR family regulator [Candidatus Omnitrophota bacterium]
MRLLIVEDEKKLAQSLKRGLREESYAVDICFDGAEGLYMAQNESYDAIILDVLLPKMNGFDLLKNLRAGGDQTPTIILTARDSIQDRVHGLNIGADDYLNKPFAFSELLARIRAIHRRHSGQINNVLTFKDIHMDVLTRTVTREDKVIELRPKEFAILQFLLENPNKTITRTMISEKVWDYSFNVASNVIDVHVKHLREKIDTDISHKLITTIKGVGYRLA